MPEGEGAAVGRDDEAFAAEETEVKKRGSEAHGVEDGGAFAEAEKGGVGRETGGDVAHGGPVAAAENGGGDGAAAQAGEAGAGDDAGEDDRFGSGRRERAGERGELHPLGELVGDVGEVAGLDRAHGGGETAVVERECEVAERDVVLVEAAGFAALLILATRGDGFEFAVGVGEIEEEFEVATDGREEGGTIQMEREIEEALVGHVGVDGAAFAELAVGVLIDALAEPVVDAGEVGGRWVKRLEVGERAADDPAVIRGVDAAGAEEERATGEQVAEEIAHGRGVGMGGGVAEEEGLCLREVAEGEGGVWGRLGVAGGELGVEGAVGVLEAAQVAREAFEEGEDGGVAVVTGLRMRVGGDGELEHAGGFAGRGEGRGFGGAGDGGEPAGDAGVVLADEGGDDFGGGGLGGGDFCRAIRGRVFS